MSRTISDEEAIGRLVDLILDLSMKVMNGEWWGILGTFFYGAVHEIAGITKQRYPGDWISDIHELLDSALDEYREEGLEKLIRVSLHNPQAMEQIWIAVSQYTMMTIDDTRRYCEAVMYDEERRD
jgi:hypothetical protein